MTGIASANPLFYCKSLKLVCCIFRANFRLRDEAVIRVIMSACHGSKYSRIFFLICDTIDSRKNKHREKYPIYSISLKPVCVHVLWFYRLIPGYIKLLNFLSQVFLVVTNNKLCRFYCFIKREVVKTSVWKGNTLNSFIKYSVQQDRLNTLMLILYTHVFLIRVKWNEDPNDGWKFLVMTFR